MNRIGDMRTLNAKENPEKIGCISFLLAIGASEI
jgi:hypothetical protein